ncbi:MAG TPA: SDR family oxidoreductase [Gammaproteobacteria bacterium]|nr:SDR family oxidoreductase [Gammaproteobacteria bacterium]
MNTNPSTGVLIIGCGDVGRRIAAAYRTAGDAVTGVVRSAESVMALQEAGVTPLHFDLDADDLPALPSRNARLFYLAPPVDVGKDDVRIERLLEHLELTGAPARFLYMSTTGVYGDCDGRWIDENAPLNPSTLRAQRRIAAEKAMREWCGARGIPWVILRVPAIYGPGRLLTERLKSGQPTIRAEECSYTNRIHVEDLVAVCRAAMARAPKDSIYNVSDGQPSTITDYLFKLADLTGLPKPPVISMQEAERSLSPSLMSFLRESKRIHNLKMLEELDLTLRYPDLLSGLKASLAAP